jgi:hypothetical protein
MVGKFSGKPRLPAKRRIDLGCGAFRIVSPTCE